MRRGTLRLAFGAFCLCVVAAWTIARISPPDVRGADAPVSDFSASRAFVHVRAIAETPHPVGSAAHEEVRAYILAVLAGLGLEARVQESSAALKVAGVTYAAHVKNVIARLPGARPGPAILLAAHYDSVPQSRGASDDGSGVATLLETARALLAGPRLDHDVVLLFSDAEEIAACGAFAFTTEELASHPIAVALNFEARGTRGAVALYDTSVGNGALIEAISASVPRVVSTSLLASLARALPNDSDATLFKRAGIPTYAFAYVDHLYEYHRYTDSIGTLDLRSLQHDGDYALPLVRYLAARPLPLPETQAVAYFDVFGRGVVSYSTLVARVLAAVTLGGLVALAGLARRTRPTGAFSLGRVAAGSAFATGALVLSALAAGLVHALLHAAIDPFVLLAKPLLATAAGLAAGVAAFFFACARARGIRTGDATSLVFGGLVVWAIPLLLTAVVVPSASFVFQWPLLFAVAGVAMWLRAGGATGARVDLALLLMLAPATFFWSYVAYSLFVMIGASAPEVVIVTASMPLLLALPVLARIGPVSLERLAGTAALAAVAITLVGGALIRTSPDLPRPDLLTYSAERHGKHGRWATDDRQHDEFVSQKIPVGETELTEPAFDLAPLETVAHAADEGDLRHSTLTVTSPRRARCVRFWETTREPIVKALVDDKLVVDVVRFSAEIDEKLLRLYTGGARQATWVAEYCGAGGETFKLDLFSPRGKSVKLRIVEVSDGLPGPPLRTRTSRDGYPDKDSDGTNITVDLKL